MRFLIVDDHEVVRRGLHQLLAQEYPDGEFKEAATAQAALEAMARALAADAAGYQPARRQRA